MNADEYRKKIEQEILDIIAAKLTTGEMTAARAREIARFVLDTLKPHMTIEQIYAAAPNFNTHFPELVSIVAKVTKDHNDMIRNAITDHVHKLLQEGKIDEAVSLLKGAT